MTDRCDSCGQPLARAELDRLARGLRSLATPEQRREIKAEATRLQIEHLQQRLDRLATQDGDAEV